MMVVSVLASIGVGLVISVPIGPMGALAALKQIEGLKRQAIGLAIGASIADTILAVLATIPAALKIPVPEQWLSLFLGTLFCIIGIIVWRSKSSKAMVQKGTPLGSFTLGFVASITNPGSILAFILGFNWLHSRGLQLEGWFAKGLLAVGIAIGAFTIWTVFLKNVQYIDKKKDLERFLAKIRQGVSTLFIIAGVWALWHALYP
ncbi:MAG: hypothetical protein OXR68_01250 [Alphaproteobacteria bacterium]|nr:hypothetical protein [Alphaproteobacteria bacterium]MDD9919237.1 hypothetical protein [Alphaproteobacteria bacterium]